MSQKSHVLTSQNFLYMVWSFYDDSAITLCTSIFMDDVIFADNRPGKGNANRCILILRSDSLEGSSVGQSLISMIALSAFASENSWCVICSSNVDNTIWFKMLASCLLKKK